MGGKSFYVEACFGCFATTPRRRRERGHDHRVEGKRGSHALACTGIANQFAASISRHMPALLERVSAGSRLCGLPSTRSRRRSSPGRRSATAFSADAIHRAGGRDRFAGIRLPWPSMSQVPPCRAAAHVRMRPLFVSILGSPASGKSYFLAAMTWRLRQVLPKQLLVASTTRTLS